MVIISMFYIIRKSIEDCNMVEGGKQGNLSLKKVSQVQWPWKRPQINKLILSKGYLASMLDMGAIRRFSTLSGVLWILNWISASLGVFAHHM